MIPRGLLSKIGGALSIVSLLVLPLVGCTNQAMTWSSLDLLSDKSIGINIKVMLIIALLFAIVALLVNAKWALLVSGIGGLGTLLTAYIIFKQEFKGFSSAFELKTGGYLAIIGFILILGDAVLPSSRQEAPKDDPI